MDFDADIALRMLANERLRLAHGWGDVRDLGDVRVVTSDAPLAGRNCVEHIDCDESRVEAALDLGFALLRAFDRDAAVRVTPLDRPAVLSDRLLSRGLTVSSRASWMAHRGETPLITNGDGDIAVAGPDDARAIAAALGRSTRWLRKLALSTTLHAMLEAGNTFYLARREGEVVGVTQLLVDGTTAGIYAVGTLRSFRRRGVASSLVARAIADARAAGCDLIYLSTDSDGDAERLYVRLGFRRMFESALYTKVSSIYVPPKLRRSPMRRPTAKAKQPRGTAKSKHPRAKNSALS